MAPCMQRSVDVSDVHGSMDVIPTRNCDVLDSREPV